LNCPTQQAHSTMLASKDYRHFQVLDKKGDVIHEFEGAEKAGHALPGDSVDVIDEGGGSVRLIVRAEKRTLVGILNLTSKYVYGMTQRGIPMYECQPMNRGYPSFRIACKERDKSRNLLVTFQFDSWDQGSELPRAGLIEILGPCEDFASEKRALAMLAQPYPAPMCDITLDTSEIRYIIDKEDLTFNIDPEGCKDIDDVITLKVLDSYVGWRIWITIADVAETVLPDTRTYSYAAQAASTAYQDGAAVRPMLHRGLSEAALSLLPGQQRMGLALRADFYGGALHNPVFQNVLVTNRESYTYESIYKSNTVPIAILRAIASSLAGRQITDSHEWVEQLMLYYNKEAAKILVAAGNGILRRHDAPFAERRAAVLAVDPTLEFLAMRSAEYCSVSDTASHWGLGTGLYCHASSPIRRFADLINQRVIKAHIDGKRIEEDFGPLILQLNQRQREIISADRDYHFLKAIEDAESSEILAKILDGRSAWVDDWKTLVRFESNFAPGSIVRLRYFCDRRKVAWKERILFEEVPLPSIIDLS